IMDAFPFSICRRCDISTFHFLRHGQVAGSGYASMASVALLAGFVKELSGPGPKWERPRANHSVTARRGERTLNGEMDSQNGTRAAARCPVCGIDRSRPQWNKGTLRLVQCGHCSMVYAYPVDPELASGRAYARRAVPFYLSAEKLESDYAPARFARELRLFRAYCPGGGVLDVGCSTGGFLYQLQHRFPGDYKVLGHDVPSAALDYAESR